MAYAISKIWGRQDTFCNGYDYCTIRCCHGVHHMRHYLQGILQGFLDVAGPLDAQGSLYNSPSGAEGYPRRSNPGSCCWGN